MYRRYDVVVIFAGASSLVLRSMLKTAARKAAIVMPVTGIAAGLISKVLRLREPEAAELLECDLEQSRKQLHRHP